MPRRLVGAAPNGSQNRGWLDEPAARVALVWGERLTRLGEPAALVGGEAELLATGLGHHGLSVSRCGLSQDGGFGVFQLFFAATVAVLFDEAAGLG